MYDLLVVGGGAAGFFGALETAACNPGAKIIILEKTNQLLAKVRISGGGRCNVTHHCFEPTPLSRHYPRGQRELKQLFRIFQASDTVRWFEEHGVSLKTEPDGRMFPVSNSSQQILDCFLREAERSNIEIKLMSGVEEVMHQGKIFKVRCSSGTVYETSKILVAQGGHPRPDAYQWIQKLGHRIVPPIPSLFTFNDPSRQFTELMGVAVQDAIVKITGTKFEARGPVLITHWGLSGPAVIRLSAWAAQHLHDVGYDFQAMVNWAGDQTETSLREAFQAQREGKKKVITNPLFGLPQRLWEKLCGMAEVNLSLSWPEMPAKTQNRLMEYIIRCPFAFRGKTTFKEEFVTCGGVDLGELNPATLESKFIPGLYFAGEVLNIDGETGGFNFQAAWTTAFVAARDLVGANKKALD
ncbi:MAG TPA: NAD(P)/FAD-dependent oxidoreductase [Cyclobacteriaceae bacterium]|nr:NAD(P)/FAD-dependent oxidoreductase [Cyclobacteriaceae bacterium]